MKKKIKTAAPACMHAAARAAIQNSRMHAAAAASGARARGGALARGARGDWRAGKTCCSQQMVL